MSIDSSQPITELPSIRLILRFDCQSDGAFFVRFLWTRLNHNMMRLQMDNRARDNEGSLFYHVDPFFFITAFVSSSVWKLLYRILLIAI